MNVVKARQTLSLLLNGIESHPTALKNLAEYVEALSIANNLQLAERRLLLQLSFEESTVVENIQILDTIVHQELITSTRINPQTSAIALTLRGLNVQRVLAEIAYPDMLS